MFDISLCRVCCYVGHTHMVGNNDMLGIQMLFVYCVMLGITLFGVGVATWLVQPNDGYEVVYDIVLL